MVEIANLSSGDDSDDGYNHLLKLNPSKLQKVIKYALFDYFVIVIQISGEFNTFATVREPSV